MPDFDKLVSKCNPPTTPIFFVHVGALAMADRLGEIQAKTFPEPVAPLVTQGENGIKEVWSGRLDTRLSRARIESDHPSGFFGALLRGVFGMKRPSPGDIMAARKRVVTLLLEMWSDMKFRSVVWDLPEMNKYRNSRVKFLLDMLVLDWLGQGQSLQPEIGRLTMDLSSRAFNVQIGVVRVDSEGNPGLTVYGDFTRARVYIACNGLERHHQKFYFFLKGLYIT